ncbi:MAG: hypothetical protein AB2809_17150 [Candidatus Thiodiazotropha sp.]
MADLPHKAKSVLLSRFFSTLFTNSKHVSDEQLTVEDVQKPIQPEIDDPHLSENVPDIEVLQGVREEVRRLRRMRKDELDKAERLVQQLKTLEKERINLLTQSKVEDDKDLLKSADTLLKKINRLERERKDCAGIAEQLALQVDELKPKLDELERASLIQLGKYLENRMSALVDHYNTIAPEVLQTVLQIRAVQRVMIHYGTGNSNGFQGEIHLPNIVAFDQKTHVPLLDGGSQVFSNSAGEIAETIKQRLFDLGYRYGTKYN